MDFQLVDRDWAGVLETAARSHTNPITIVCPFIKLGALRKLLKQRSYLNLRVITRFNLDDFANGVSDIQAMELLLQKGARVRGIKGLHAKVYVFGNAIAFATSANLTQRGLSTNEEFGISSRHEGIVAACGNYFSRLWDHAGEDLTYGRLSTWKQRIDREVAERTATPRPPLGDEGAAGSLGTPAPLTGDNAAADQFALKFSGLATDRVPLSTPISELLARGGHRFLGFPNNKRPRAVEEGALMFISRMTSNPNDHVIYACARAMAYKSGRDDAGPDDLRLFPWTKDWGRFIRLTDYQCLAGSLVNGVSVNTMIEDLGHMCFKSTASRPPDKASPKKSLMQKAWIELTPEAGAYLSAKLHHAFRSYGQLSAADICEFSPDSTNAVI